MGSKFENNSAIGIIVAAGSSNRMSGIDKIIAPLDNIPLVIHSLKAFDEAKTITDIVLVIKDERIYEISDMLKKYSFKKNITVTSGGATRQQSVECGMKSVSYDANYFAIHDGARPLVTSDIVDRVVNDAILHGAATAAMPVKDTMKLSVDGSFIDSTPVREQLYICQTPQVFSAKLYKKGLSAAKKIKKEYTDDCQVVEQIGKRVYLSVGSYENIKVTTPDDLIVAGAIIKARNDVLK